MLSNGSELALAFKMAFDRKTSFVLLFIVYLALNKYTPGVYVSVPGDEELS